MALCISPTSSKESKNQTGSKIYKPKENLNHSATYVLPEKGPVCSIFYNLSFFVCVKYSSQFLVFTYVISKFRSIKQRISIRKCLWNCREFKTTHLGQFLKRKNISFKSYRRKSIRHFSKKCTARQSWCPT